MKKTRAVKQSIFLDVYDFTALKLDRFARRSIVLSLLPLEPAFPAKMEKRIWREREREQMQLKPERDLSFIVLNRQKRDVLVSDRSGTCRRQFTDVINLALLVLCMSWKPAKCRESCTDKVVTIHGAL
jgi:hypothetical protein